MNEDQIIAWSVQQIYEDLYKSLNRRREEFGPSFTPRIGVTCILDIAFSFAYAMDKDAEECEQLIFFRKTRARFAAQEVNS